MFAVSEKFLAAMEYQPYIARITLDGTDTIQGDAIEQINFTGGDNDSTKSISLGTAVAGSVEVILQKSLVDVAVAGREMFIELGLELDGKVEWVPMGRYTTTDPTEDDGILTVPGLDALAAKFDREFEPFEGMNFEQEGGVDALALLQAMCQRRGVTVDTSSLTTAALTFAPTGYTERRIIGMIAALSGKNAYMDRYGVLRFRWYEPADVSITDDDYYEGGMEKAAYGFQAKWLKCYVEPMEETLCEGDADGEQGIYFECPWVTEDILAELWEQLQGFTYTPTPSLSFQGDPRLDPGDIVTMEDSGGNVVQVPLMSITHEYDGGLLTRVAAQGQRKTESHEGPVMREVKRTKAQILKKANEIELRVDQLDESLEGDELIARINISEGLVKIQANCIELSGVATTDDIPTSLSQLLNDTDFQDRSGVVTIIDGTVTADFVNALALKVQAANIEGVLAVGQLPENIALTSAIPTSLSQLLNDSDFQDRSGVVTIIDGTVTADFVNALALKVKAANIEGVLAVGQLPENIALTSAIPTSLSQLLNDSGYQDLAGVVTIIDGTVTADFVNALALKVKAANIEGVLAVGQLPEGVAYSTDIPSNLSDLVNDSGYLNETGVVSIVNGVVDADYINALGITAKYIVVTTSSGSVLFQAGDSNVKIAGWNVDENSFYSGNTFASSACFICTGSTGSGISIADSPKLTGWMIKAGSKFGVTKNGAAYMSDAYIQGEVVATSGKVGGWQIVDSGLYANSQTYLYSNGTFCVNPATNYWCGYLETEENSGQYVFVLSASTPLRIGNTTLTEAKLKSLLALI